MAAHLSVGLTKAIKKYIALYLMAIIHLMTHGKRLIGLRQMSTSHRLFVQCSELSKAGLRLPLRDL